MAMDNPTEHQLLHVLSERKHPGFTLVELLLVIAVVASLMMVVTAAVSPMKSLMEAYDAERRHNVNQLAKALMQKIVREWALSAGIPEGEGNAADICAQGQTCSGVSLDDLPPDYIAAIPRDPAEPCANKTGYRAYQSLGRPHVLAAHVGKLPGQVVGCGITWVTGEGTYGSMPGSVLAPAAALDSDTFVFVRSNTVRVGSVVGTSIVWDTAEIPYSGNMSIYATVARLDGGTFIVAYTGGFEVNVRVGSFNGSTVSWVTGEVTIPSSAFFPSVKAIDSDSFVLTYGDFSGNEDIAVRVGSVVGGSVIWETGIVYIPQSFLYYSDIAVIDSDTVVVSYKDEGNGNAVTARVGTIDYGADTIAWGSPASANLGSIGYTSSTVTLGSDAFVLATMNALRIGRVTGTDVTWVTSPTSFAGSGGGYNAIVALDSDTFLVAWADDSGAVGTMRAGTLAGGALTWNTLVVPINSVDTSYLFLSAFDGSRFIVSYRDDNGLAGLRIGAFQ